MAAAMRGRFGYITKKLVQFSFSHHRCIRDNVIFHFHRSAFLGVSGQEIKMPSLSPTMSEGAIVKWLKKEGDTITAGDVLCDIQTDKAVVSFEIEEDGVLAKILIPENTSDIKVGTLIALMVNEGEDWKKVTHTAEELGPASSVPPASGSSPPSDSDSDCEPISIPGATFKTSTLTSYGPAVRYLLEKYQIKANTITPTGHRCKLLKEDVMKYIQDNKITEKPIKQVPLPPKKTPSKPAVQPPAGKAKKLVTSKAKPSGFVDLEVSNIRKVIAKRLSESKRNIPHSYGTITCSLDKIMQLRKQLKDDCINVSVNDFIIKAVGHTLQQFPEVNVHLIQNQVVPVQSIDISVAVATKRGLMTPIVHNVPRKGLMEISSTVKDLAERARDGKLQPHEFQGGSFTISNLGMFGIKEFSAIINPPQCAILAIAAGQKILDNEGKSTIKMNITLSYDRRAFDEGVAAEFLKGVQTMLEDPTMITIRGLSALQQTLEA